MKKPVILATLLVICAIVAGCATLSVYVKVNPDTSLSNFKMTIETTSMFYSLGGGQLKSSIDPNIYTYDEAWTGDKVTITITAKSTLKSNDPTNWTIQKVDNRLVYTDKRFTSFLKKSDNQYTEAMMRSFSVNYYLEMPGAITTNNANKVDGNKAEWHLHGDMLSTPIQAECELPIIPYLSGFDTILGLLGIVGACLVILKKK